MLRSSIVLIAALSVVSTLLVLSYPGLFESNNVYLKADDQLENLSSQKDSTFLFAKYYGSHMVLQRDKSNIIWGYAKQQYIGEDVTLTVKGWSTHSLKSQVQKRIFDVGTAGRMLEGVWSFQIPPSPAGGPYKISVTLDTRTIAISDVMFGDVWVCSGQSNMQFTTSMMFNASGEIKLAAKYPNVRLFTVGMQVSAFPLYDYFEVEQEWAVASPKSVAGQNWTHFSAVCWEYGRHLYDNLQLPIGLVASTWGGTPIEAWSSVDALHQCKKKTDSIKAVSPHTHSVLYNAMIHPLLNLTITGVVWYQGEANVGSTIYDCKFYALISDWRLKFHIGSAGGSDLDFPFGFVQLAPNKNETKVGKFPSLRWQQTMNQGFAPNPDMPKVFMAVTIDLPDFKSPFGTIHPRDKETVGRRLAQASLGVAYKKDLRYLGPFPTAFYVQYANNSLTIEVDRNQTSLISNDVTGFEICCSSQLLCNEDDEHWKPAEITTLNKYIIISWKCSSEKIMGVRYLWSETPCSYKRCPIYSKEGALPMPPFMFRGELYPGKLIPGSNDLINKVTIYHS